MSTKQTRDGGPAFPIVHVLQPWDRDRGEWGGVTTEVQSHGLSLRDYFAGQALIAYTVAASTLADIAVRRNQAFDMSTGVIVEQAYAVADAMLAEREK